MFRLGSGADAALWDCGPLRGSARGSDPGLGPQTPHPSTSAARLGRGGYAMRVLEKWGACLKRRPDSGFSQPTQGAGDGLWRTNP